MFDEPENVELIAKAYTTGLEETTPLSHLIPEKGIHRQDGKVMVTTFGVRARLTHVLTKLLT